MAPRRISELPEYLTFDDVLLKPAASAAVPADVNTATRLTGSIEPNVPLISSRRRQVR
jgi:IMP dehydrogenase